MARRRLVPRALQIVAALLLAGLTTAHLTGAAGQSQAQSQARARAQDGVARLLTKLETVITSGQPDGYLDLLSPRADRERATLAVRELVSTNVTRVVVRERDRAGLDGTLPGEGYRLMVEIFTERGIQASIANWQLDIRLQAGGNGADDWWISDQKPLDSVDGLFKLGLNRLKQFRVSGLVVKSEDLDVSVPDGHLFVAEAGGGPTAVVIMPATEAAIRFRPTPETERGQVKIHSGSETLETPASAVFVRLHPGDFVNRFPAAALESEAADPALVRRAEQVFRTDVARSFGIDLSDFSRDSWSFLPHGGDILLEMHTRRYGVLTYTKVANEPEDISLFDRAKRHNIAIYPSRARVEARGRFFDEDAHEPFAVELTDLDLFMDPDRRWIDGVAQLRIRVNANAINSLNLRLAESLAIGSIYSPEHGRLLSLRVRNQSSTVVTLPSYLTRGSVFTLLVSYSGRLAPLPPDREGISPQSNQDPFGMLEETKFQGEPYLIYSTNTYWYPQGSVTSYGLARMRITVPDKYQVLASGQLLSGYPKPVPPVVGKLPAVEYEFRAGRPVRYLTCVISRFQPVATATIQTDYAGAGDVSHVTLSVEANPRLLARGRDALPVAENLVRYYRSVVGDAPYPSLTVGLVESETPGGHAPAYLSVINQPLPAAAFSWGNDPAAFPNYPEFFLAHELAHQWWGQAVGWRSYHERWISEGFAQYFAALYARVIHGDDVFNDVIRRMARWGKDTSAEGPISLGYRLGHLRNNSRIFRALVYNKAAVVLDMLRRQIGDDAFYRGLRRFYRDWRFRKAATEDVRRAFEAESGKNLEVFFEQWIHGAGIPIVRPSWRLDENAAEPTAIIELTQVGPLFDYPVTVTLRYANGPAADILVAVTERVTTARVKLSGALRAVEVNRDGLTILTTAK